MRPLYLHGRPGMTVGFDEPALVVNVPDKTRQLFPLARLSRVLVEGKAEWSMAALLACADAGIVVVFLNDQGEVRGRWLGRPCVESALLENLAALLERSEGVEQYRDWFAGMRRMAVRSAARRLGFSDWKDADYNALESWAQQALTPDWLALRKPIQGAVLTAVLRYLQDVGLDVGSERHASDRIFLADDLAQLLALDFLPMLQSWRRQYGDPPERKVLYGLIEQRSRRLEHLLRGLLNKLHLCLLGKR